MSASKPTSARRRIEANGGKIIAACMDSGALQNIRMIQGRRTASGTLAPSVSAVIRDALAFYAAHGAH